MMKVFKSGKIFMSGVGVTYEPSVLTIDHSDGLHLARHVHPGRRIDAHQVLCQVITSLSRCSLTCDRRTPDRGTCIS